MSSPFMTVPEVAEHLRIRPRKVYDLVARGEIPHHRVGGKLLFDAAEVQRWIERAPTAEAAASTPLPAVIAGSSDLLLDWAVRSSGAALALMSRGSGDGLRRMLAREACAAALHLPAPDLSQFNVEPVAAAGSTRDWVLVQWAVRSQGLVVAAGNPLGLRSIDDLGAHRPTRLRIGRRQAGAGSRELFDLLVSRSRACAALGPSDFVDGLGSEDEIAVAIGEGRIDCGLAIEAVARRFGLGFVPLVRERVDLLLDRAAFFEPEFQRLMEFCRAPEFGLRAEALGGYDVTGFGRVVWNSPRGR